MKSNNLVTLFCTGFFAHLSIAALCFADIELSPTDNFVSAINNAPSGTTILLNDGAYKVDRFIQISRAGISLRSKSGNRNAVILDGNQGATPLDAKNFISEIIQVSASNVTIEDLTVRYAGCHSIHAFGASDHTIRNLILRNLHIYDCGEQLVKVNSNGNQSNLCWVDSGLVENCRIEFIDNSVMSNMGTYFYTGGIDVHGGNGWIIRNNTFSNIWREDKMMEHAVHFWSRSRSTVVENNTFINCWRAIGFGMKTSASGLVRSYADKAGENPYFGHIGGMVRNNVIYNDASHRLETGVELMKVINTEVYHNTVMSAAQPFNCIEYRWSDTRVIIINNLCSHRIIARDGAQAQTAANIIDAAFSLFKDPYNLDFHLKSGASTAIDKGDVLGSSKAGMDIDGEAHGSNPDIGADEFMDNAIAIRPVNTTGTSKVKSRAVCYYDLSGRKMPEQSLRRLSVKRMENGGAVLFIRPYSPY